MSAAAPDKMAGRIGMLFAALVDEALLAAVTSYSHFKETRMSIIIAARFETFEAAQGAAEALMNDGVPSSDLHTFYVNPPGEHAQLPMGGDRLYDAGSKGAMQGAFGGAALLGVVGAVLGALIGFNFGQSLWPVAIGAGAGAYAGSLMGGLSMLGREKPVDLSIPPESSINQGVRASGVLLAVRADTPQQHQRIAEILGLHGGIEIERAQGRWEAGQWVDFDPLTERRDV